MQSDPTKHVDQAVREWLPTLLDSYGFPQDAKLFRSLPPLTDEESQRRAMGVLRILLLGTAQLLVQSTKVVVATPEHLREKVQAYHDNMMVLRWSALAAAMSTKSLLLKNDAILN